MLSPSSNNIEPINKSVDKLVNDKEVANETVVCDLLNPLDKQIIKRENKCYYCNEIVWNDEIYNQVIPYYDYVCCNVVVCGNKKECYDSYIFMSSRSLFYIIMFHLAI